MDEIKLVEKHVLSMRENYPKTKEPKKPIEPKMPPEPEAIDTIAHKRWRKYQQRFPARHKAWEKRLEKWGTETMPAWELEENRLKRLRQLKMTENGTLIGGSANRAIKMTNQINELGMEYFLNGDGDGFPGFERIFDNITMNEPFLVFTDILAFKKFIEVVAKATKQARIEVSSETMTFKPVYAEQIEASFASAEWRLDVPVGENMIFGINPSYLRDMFKLFSQLKIKEVKMYMASPIRPIFFVADNIEYVISPLRIGS